MTLNFWWPLLDTKWPLIIRNNSVCPNRVEKKAKSLLKNSRKPNSGPSPGWYLEKVEIEIDGKLTEFNCQRWFSKKEDDGKIEREFTLGQNNMVFMHKLQIYTGDKLKAGTDANVWIQLYAEGKVSKN